ILVFRFGGRGLVARPGALAGGAAAAGLPGSRMPGPADIDAAVTTAGPPDPACPLAVPFVPPADPPADPPAVLSSGPSAGPSTTNAPAPLP
ncbi:hypothetical protein ABT361_32260, partial [Nonomuraea wenchangensis]